MTAHVAPFRLDALLDAHRHKDVLRFITCGSVDDGKSTLIGRLLHDTKRLFDDQLVAWRRDSRKWGTQNGEPDFALLVDGLSAEREQGITIDVAYRFFATERRTFIVADTPGHEQYTRNMATGASTADVAVLLVDARKGLTRQTRRHTLLVSMLGIRRVVLAINKMDTIGWDEGAYHAIVADYQAFARRIGFDDLVGIPLSAKNGDNVVRPAEAALWYTGPTLLNYLERVPAGAPSEARFRMPVQYVNRPSADFRGYAGLIASGTVATGERVRVLPSGRETTIARIVTFDGDLARASAGQSVTLELADDLDISRGDMITTVDSNPLVADRLQARLFWVGERGLAPGASFHVKIGAATALARVETIESRIDPDTAERENAATLEANDIGDVVLALDRPLAFDRYARSRDTGSLILIDRESFETAGMGLVLNAARYAEAPAPSVWQRLRARLGLS
jgi:sulfate adenylyltransferase subunit 1